MCSHCQIVECFILSMAKKKGLCWIHNLELLHIMTGYTADLLASPMPQYGQLRCCNGETYARMKCLSRILKTCVLVIEQQGNLWGSTTGKPKFAVCPSLCPEHNVGYTAKSVFTKSDNKTLGKTEAHDKYQLCRVLETKGSRHTNKYSAKIRKGSRHIQNFRQIDLRASHVLQMFEVANGR